MQDRKDGHSLHTCLTGEGLYENPGNAQAVKYRGAEYRSYAELCRKYKISYRAFMKHLRKGMSVDQAVRFVGSVKGNSKKITYKGVRYESITKLCEARGVKVITFYKRLEAGRTIEEALTRKRSNNQTRKVAT